MKAHSLVTGTWCFLILGILVAAIAYFNVEYRGPLKWAFLPESIIRHDLLEACSKGTSFDDCLKKIRAAKDYDQSQSLKVDTNRAVPEGVNAKAIGIKSITVKLSQFRYRESLVTQNVYATYAFDEKGDLFDVLIEKTNLGP